MVNFYNHQDIDKSLIKQRTIAIIGYGSQGRAQALNLRDSGANVVVGVRQNSASRSLAQADDLMVMNIDEAAGKSDIIVMLVPDETHGTVYEQGISKNIKPGSMLMFAHRLCIKFGIIEPRNEIDIAMVSPKAIGPKVRESYLANTGVYALVAVHNDYTRRALATCLSYASALGCDKKGILPTTFASECQCDLFGEQAVLCGGIPALIEAGFATLIEAGYPLEAAYFETVFEAKLIVDMILDKGLYGMMEKISTTAAFGAHGASRSIVTAQTKQAFAEILANIQSVTFRRKSLRKIINFNNQDVAFRKILSVTRRAKFINIMLEGGRHIIIHLGMSGKLTFDSKPRELKHDHIVFEINDGDSVTALANHHKYLIFNDPRRFGICELVEGENLASYFAGLGPEPFSNEFTASYIYNSLKNRSIPIKTAVLDQRIFAGMGNIYACEALADSRIHPLTPARNITYGRSRKLMISTKAALTRAIEAGGSTLRDYVNADSKKGYFQHQFMVYNRENQPCYKCSEPIERIIVGGRSTFFCPSCQGSIEASSKF
jgi:ketol-acid reductoisomerase